MKKILIVSRGLDGNSGVQTSLRNLLYKLNELDNLNIILLLEEKKTNDLKIPLGIENKKVEFCHKYYNYYLSFREAKKYMDLIEFILFINFKIFRKLMLKIGAKGIFENILVKKIKKDNEQYDLIIDFHGYGYYLTKYIARNFKSTKKITFVHDEEINWLKDVHKEIGLYQYICCVSKSVKDKFDKYRPDLKNKSIVFSNIINIDKIREMSKKECDLSNIPTTKLLTVGRLVYQKGYDLLIEIANELSKTKINFIWYIIGDGELKYKLKDKINKFGLSQKVRLLGNKNNPYCYMKNCDIYIQTSRHEGYGLTICEAKILGKPIIATNIAPFKEQIADGINGYICKPTVKDFIEKIKLLVENKSEIDKIKKNLENYKFDNEKEINFILNLLN